jgi:hypothetical protein
VNVGKLVDSTEKAFLKHFSTLCLAGVVEQGCNNHKKQHFFAKPPILKIICSIICHVQARKLWDFLES